MVSVASHHDDTTAKMYQSQASSPREPQPSRKRSTPRLPREVRRDLIPTLCVARLLAHARCNTGCCYITDTYLNSFVVTTALQNVLLHHKINFTNFETICQEVSISIAIRMQMIC